MTEKYFEPSNDLTAELLVCHPSVATPVQAAWHSFRKMQFEVLEMS